MDIIYILVVFTLLWLTIYQHLQIRSKEKTITALGKWYDIAFSDALTGLKNQAAYSRMISDLEKKKLGGWMIIVFDINNFKGINDTCGHLEGDKALKSFADTLKRSFPPYEYSTYRIGGDEFVVIAENANETKIHEILTDINRAELNRLSFTTAKGYALSKEGEPFDNVFNRADKMLYKNKQNAKSKHYKKV